MTEFVTTSDPRVMAPIDPEAIERLRIAMPLTNIQLPVGWHWDLALGYWIAFKDWE